MSDQHEALQAGVDAVTALLTVLAGTTKRKDYGQMSRVVEGRRHLWSCNSGMWLQAGDSLRGGQPCSARCVQAAAALRLTERFMLLIIELGGEAPAPTVQLSLIADNADQRRRRPASRAAEGVAS